MPKEDEEYYSYLEKDVCKDNINANQGIIVGRILLNGHGLTFNIVDLNTNKLVDFTTYFTFHKPNWIYGTTKEEKALKTNTLFAGNLNIKSLDIIYGGFGKTVWSFAGKGLISSIQSVIKNTNLLIKCNLDEGWFVFHVPAGKYQLKNLRYFVSSQYYSHVLFLENGPIFESENSKINYIGHALFFNDLPPKFFIDEKGAKEAADYAFNTRNITCNLEFITKKMFMLQ